ncbi:MAG: hypothetical protein GTN78_22220 [Gemmatimonadales bacterium]|nr:hypothetical protein [Gemmatimonadales bacterium]NIN10874.1 hypothetical protein [Gemmatimonadales bacterium]NIR02882.1 hypothetical protein [Gemmatimonadales bacterium]NIS66516.1 hypothetical protein [Gemmatimonadales bacterium]
MRIRLAPLILSVLAVGVVACWSSGARFDELEPERGDELALEVENQNFYDATLYAISGSRRQRLGTVGGNGKGSFTFPWVAPEVRIEILLISVGSYLTQPISVDRGDVLQLTIEPDLDRKIPLRRRRRP